MHVRLWVGIIQNLPTVSGTAQMLPLILYFAEGWGQEFSSEISPVWGKKKMSELRLWLVRLKVPTGLSALSCSVKRWLYYHGYSYCLLLVDLPGTGGQGCLPLGRNGASHSMHWRILVEHLLCGKWGLGGLAWVNRKMVPAVV